MTTADNTATRTETRYAVEVAHKGVWLEMEGFSSVEKDVAVRGAEVLVPLSNAVRIVEVIVTTTITENVVFNRAKGEQ